MKEIMSSEFEKMAKKKDDWDPNPWAVCHSTVGPDKDDPKFERCVHHVKDKQKDCREESKSKEALEETKDLQGPPREFNAIPYKNQVARDEQFGDKFTPQKRRPLIPKKETTSPKKEHADFLRLFWKGEEVPPVQANTNRRWVIIHKAKTACSCVK